MKKIMLGLLLIVGMLNLSIIVSASESWWMPIVDYISIGDKFNCTCSVHNGTHNGQDFPAAKGSAVRATKSGTVVASYNSCTGSHYSGAKESLKCTVGTSCGSKSMGNYVTLKHSDGTSSIYMHLSSVAVSNGTYISQGQYLGGVGTTGSSTGNHLHFAIKNASGTYVNPLNYINTNNPGDYTEPPTNVSVSVNKSLYVAGETVTFICAGTNVSGYTIGIDRDGSRIFTGDINGVYDTSFTDAGTYSAYVTAWNTVGSVDSARATFTVYNTVPTNVSVSTNKSNFSAGETVAFICYGTNVCGYTIGITKDGNRIFTGDINGIFETSFSEPGSYAAYVTARNFIGSVDSQWITFSVYNTGPSYAAVSINKENFLIGEEFSISGSSDSYCEYYMSIFDVDSGDIIYNGNISNIYKNSFQRAGHYTAYMTAYNSYGSVNSNWIEFYVFGEPPTTATLVADKNKLSVGDSIAFNVFTDAYYVKIYMSIYLMDGTVVYEGNIPYSFTYTPSKGGEYTTHISAYTHESGIDSNTISFSVHDTPPINPWIVADKTVVDVGEELTFTFNADKAMTFALGIDKVGVGRICSPNVGETTFYTTSFSESGTYKVYVTAVNTYGSIDSSTVTFYVIDPSEVLSTHSAVTKAGDAIQISTELAGQHNNAIIFAVAFREDVLTAVESYRVIETEREKVFYLSPKKDSEVVKIYLWDPENLSPIGEPEIIPKSAWSEAEE